MSQQLSTNEMIVYSYLEIPLLFVLVFRIFVYSRIDFNVLKSHFEILLYIFTVFTNSLLCIIIGENKTITLVFDIILPLSIIIPILARQKRKIYKLFLLSFIPITYFALIPANDKIRYLLYILSMMILFTYSIKLAVGSGKDLKKSPIYLLFALDFLVTIILQQLYGFNINWKDSVFVGFVGIVVLFFYLINLILAHVYIRRFFIN
jgi:hypothetical protein